MQIAVARLYALVLSFFISALKWYHSSRAMHALKSILQPWELTFQHMCDAIGEAAENVRQLADAALKAEVRDTRVGMDEGRKEWEGLRREMGALRQENEMLTQIVRAGFSRVEESMSSKSIASLLLHVEVF